MIDLESTKICKDLIVQMAEYHRMGSNVDWNQEHL